MAFHGTNVLKINQISFHVYFVSHYSRRHKSHPQKICFYLSLSSFALTFYTIDQNN